MMISMEYYHHHHHHHHKNLILALCLVVLAGSCTWSSHGQISTACTNSIIKNFTPCLNFITGSSSNGGGSTATAGCCESLKSIMTDSVDCGCLIITGNVPIPIPMNTALAISLPKICQSIGTTVPIQCHATAMPLPAPGPALFGPSSSATRRGPAPAPADPLLPPNPIPSSPPLSPRASKAVISAVTVAPTPAMSPSEVETDRPSLAPTISPSIHPVSRSNLSSSSARSSNPWPAIMILLWIVGTLFFEEFIII